MDEFHHVSASEDSILGSQLYEFIAHDRVHVIAMTGSYFRGDAVPILTPENEAKFDTITHTYYEQLNVYKYLKTLDIGYFFYSGSYADDILKVLDSNEKTIVHFPNVNSRESTKDKRFALCLHRHCRVPRAMGAAFWSGLFLSGHLHGKDATRNHHHADDIADAKGL